jgi:hypothetical protein
VTQRREPGRPDLVDDLNLDDTIPGNSKSTGSGSGRRKNRPNSTTGSRRALIEEPELPAKARAKPRGTSAVARGTSKTRASSKLGMRRVEDEAPKPAKASDSPSAQPARGRRGSQVALPAAEQIPAAVFGAPGGDRPRREAPARLPTSALIPVPLDLSVPELLPNPGEDPQERTIDLDLALYTSADADPVEHEAPAAPSRSEAKKERVPELRLPTSAMMLRLPSSALLGADEEEQEQQSPLEPLAEQQDEVSREAFAQIRLPSMPRANPLQPSASKPSTAGVPFQIVGKWRKPIPAKEVATWVSLFVRAVRGTRLYAENNAVLRDYVNQTASLISELLARAYEISLTVRDEAILYEGEEVLADDGKPDALPHLLYENSLRRLTFVEGFSKDELLSLLSALCLDYSDPRHLGEDMVSALWRLDLPHLRYASSNLLNSAAWAAKARGSDKTKGMDFERAERKVNDIIAMLPAHATMPNPSELAAVLELTPKEVSALEAVKRAQGDGFDILETAALLNQKSLGDAPLARFAAELEAKDARIELGVRLFDELVAMLLESSTPLDRVDKSPSLGVLVQLVDAQIAAEHFHEVTGLVRRFKAAAASEGAARSKLANLGRVLLPVLGTAERIGKAMVALNKAPPAPAPAPAPEPLEFLTALGRDAVLGMIEQLELLDRTAHRRTVSELILQHGTPDSALLLSRLAKAKKWTAAADLLALARPLPPVASLPIVQRAAKHADPRVRIAAIAFVQVLPPGPADTVVAQRILDPELDVRVAALHAARQRRSKDAVQALETAITRDDFHQKQALELKLLLATYAALAPSRAITVLAGILHPGVFGRKTELEAQIAAAEALGQIGTPAAKDELARGAKSSKQRLRDACRAAIEASNAAAASEAEASGGATPASSATAPAGRQLAPSVPSLPAIPGVRGRIVKLGNSDTPPPSGAASPAGPSRSRYAAPSSDDAETVDPADVVDFEELPDQEATRILAPSPSRSALPAKAAPPTRGGGAKPPPRAKSRSRSKAGRKEPR